MMPQRRNLLLAIIAGLLIGGAVFVWLSIYYLVQHQPAAVVPKNQVTVTPPIATIDTTTPQPDSAELVARRIDGTLVPADQAQPYPIAVMIENAAFGGVRPQFGLSSAQVIYEILVEGGITRLMAVYGGELPKKIGPVRSSRPTFLEFSSEYDAIYAHAGGSPESLQAIAGLHIKDLSALGTDSRFFFRDTTRVAPHNLFTSDTLLTLALRDKNLLNTTADFPSWPYKADSQPLTPLADEQFIDIDFGSGPLYAVRFVYDYATNSYQRYNGGELQHDAVNDALLTAKNVVVQIVPAGTIVDETGRVDFSVTGEGKVYVVRDAEVIDGTWKKSLRTERTEFFDTAGQVIQLNRGTTWVEIVPVTGGVTYQ